MIKLIEGASNYSTMHNFPCYVSNYTYDVKVCPNCGNECDIDSNECDYCDEYMSNVSVTEVFDSNLYYSEKGNIENDISNINKKLHFHEVKFIKGYNDDKTFQFHVKNKYNMRYDNQFDYTKDKFVNFESDTDVQEEYGFEFNTLRELYSAYCSEIIKIRQWLISASKRYGFVQYTGF